MEKLTICCLKGISNLPLELQIISLSDKDEVVIGRGSDVDVQMSSEIISKKHAVLRKTPKGWTIIDDHSRSGLFVNNVRLEPGVSQILNDYDLIQIGGALTFGAQAPFVYQYKKQAMVKRLRREDISQPEGDHQLAAHCEGNLNRENRETGDSDEAGKGIKAPKRRRRRHAKKNW